MPEQLTALLTHQFKFSIAVARMNRSPGRIVVSISVFVRFSRSHPLNAKQTHSFHTQAHTHKRLLGISSQVDATTKTETSSSGKSINAYVSILLQLSSGARRLDAIPQRNNAACTELPSTHSTLLNTQRRKFFRPLFIFTSKTHLVFVLSILSSQPQPQRQSDTRTQNSPTPAKQPD